MRKTDAAATALFLVVSPPLVTAQAPPPATAFVNVTVLTMVDDRIRPRQTVLVRDGRIAGVGGSDEIQVPPDAAVIDGEGRFLVPGLTDAHVHLPTGMPWGPTRDDFGDAPIYLAYGVTTVVNLGGTPAQLEWRRRIESGERLGPTIYSAGPFVNEPRVTTPEEVEQDIVAQSRAGFDLVKFHELPNTTVGLSAPAYRRMIEAAHRAGLPLVGHAPVNLGLEEMLAARQSVAHVGMLSNIYFLPVASNRLALFTTLAAFVVLIGVSASSFVQMLFRRRRSMTLGTTLALASFAALAHGTDVPAGRAALRQHAPARRVHRAGGVRGGRGSGGDLAGCHQLAGPGPRPQAPSPRPEVPALHQAAIADAGGGRRRSRAQLLRVLGSGFLAWLGGWHRPARTARS